MSEFYKTSQTKLNSQQTAAFNLTQKFPDVTAILNSCDEMIKIASHTREKAKILQKQMGDLTRAIPIRAAALKRPATVTPLTPTTQTPVDYEMHQIHVTTTAKQNLSSCSSSSLSSTEQKAVVKLKGITTINPVTAVVPTKRPQPKGLRKTDASKASVQKIATQRRVNSLLPPAPKQRTLKTPVSGGRSKGQALSGVLPPFKKNSSTNSNGGGSQMRVTSAKAPASKGCVEGNASCMSPRLLRAGKD